MGCVALRPFRVCRRRDGVGEPPEDPDVFRHGRTRSDKLPPADRIGRRADGWDRAGWAAGRVLRGSEKAAPSRLSVPPPAEPRPHAADTEPSIERETARRLLLYAVPPAWIAAGLADWLCHRATRIEDTAGAKESLIHLLMQAEFGVPVLLTLFCEITPPVIASELAAFVAHEATVYWDLKYTTPRREISPIEQQVHGYLELERFSLEFRTRLACG